MTAAVILLVIANALAILWCVGTVGRAYDMMHTIYNALKAQEELNRIQNELNEEQAKFNHNVLEITKKNWRYDRWQGEEDQEKLNSLRKCRSRNVATERIR